MNVNQFEILCSLLNNKLRKNDTNYRDAITVKERLLLTLRFLATGDSYVISLQYLFRISKQSISKIIPEVCDAIIDLLKDYVKIKNIMVEKTPLQKNDEQHPLLKMETGGGDIDPATAVSPTWNVTCTSKRTWKDRWPEFLSAFWLSGMFLGIFCLILWGLLGCSALRRQHSILMLNYNSSRPGSEVYYHHILQRNSAIPFTRFSEYLSNMATLYSSLRFNVVFLIDDTLQSSYRGSRRARFFNRLISYHSDIGDYKLDKNDQQELKDFNLKHPNVNFTFVPLSKFMALTPLRFKWRTIPIAYLTFYARVFSVWQTGGIGIDLNYFSAQFNHCNLPDRRISAILKQHNDGIKPDDYANTLNNIDREEQNEFLTLFFGMVHQILNETRSFFNRTLLYSQDSVDKDNNLASETLIRPHRNKRELYAKAPDSNSSNTEKLTTIVPEEIVVINTTDVNIVDAVYENVPPVMTAEATVNELNKIEISNQNKSRLMHNKTANISEPPQILLVYDFSLLSDNNMGPSYILPDALVQPNSPTQPTLEIAIASDNTTKKTSYILSINADGTFVAASRKQHPFLAHIMTAGCRRVPPRFAIQNAIISQCSHIFRDDVYCSNIYLL